MNKMNINDNVYVFLTDAGKRILKEKAAWTFLSPVYDEKTGLLCEQLWFIMSVFGPHIWLGMPETLFRKNMIYFEKPKTYEDDPFCVNCKAFKSHSEDRPEEENKMRNPDNCIFYLGNNGNCPRLFEKKELSFSKEEV
ncbi:MAG: hypothetical protein M0P12_11615 [Paludibacteraceae bacterium]|nr:hypothetical protein [Paludibacteraceae bacterium]MCK9616028.1 hypothetical protein [Candidatus Omnitrophota bacterium]